MFKLASSFVSLLLAARFAVAQSVVAHFMAQQLYSYEDEHISADITKAMELGIEAFVMNIVDLDYELDKIQQVVYPAAERLGFKILYSIDTYYEWTPAEIVQLVSATAKSPATYLWNGKPLLSSFSPDREGYGDQFWADVKSGLAAQGVEIALAPALTGTNAQELASNFPSADGFANWWAWPSDTADNLTTTQDIDYKAVTTERGGPYIMGVSPWQFKNIKDQSWVQNSDYLYDYRWKQAINDVKPDIVEIITWNDYGESHYITEVNPIVAQDPDSVKYTTGADHTGWGLMTKYYISWFKSCLGSSSSTSKRSLRQRSMTRPAYRDLRKRFEPVTVTVVANIGQCTASSTTTIDAPASEPTAAPAPPSTTDVPADPAPTAAPGPVPPPPAEPAPEAGSCEAPAFEKDVLVWYFRIFPKGVTCSGGQVPRNKDLVSDSIFAWVGLTSPASVRIDAGSSTGTYDLPAGPHVVGIPFPSNSTSDETPYFQIIRDGAPVVSGHATASIKFSGCEFYDMNARVGIIDTLEATETPA